MYIPLSILNLTFVMSLNFPDFSKITIRITNNSITLVCKSIKVSYD